MARASRLEIRLDLELAGFTDPDGEDLVEPLIEGRRFELSMGREDCFVRNAPASSALRVSFQRLLRIGIEEAGDRAKTCALRGCEVFSARFARGIGVINDEALPGIKAGVEQQVFPPAGPEHVEVDPDVGPEEALDVERRFSGPLYTGEDDCFQRSPALAAHAWIALSQAGSKGRH
jgi:hypothetical protein